MILLLTPGDPSGVGPEITLKALKKARLAPSTQVVCVGAAGPLKRLARRMNVRLDEVSSLDALKQPGRRPRSRAWLMPAPTAHPGLSSGPAFEGFQAGWSIETATRLVLAGKAQAVVTGPINKGRLQAGGYLFPGHTEMLASICSGGAKPLPVTMMLANERLRVSLVTTHVSLQQLPRAITHEAIARTVSHTLDALRNWWRIRRPRIAICGLNPHAGEGGLFGNEEGTVIAPLITALQRQHGRGVELIGPLPADTLFANHLLASAKERFDAVVCMYHDQGLIPVKLIDFYKTVNVSLGLPILRTSVDHGVAYDLVGTGKARPDSMISALELAEKLASGYRKKP